MATEERQCRICLGGVADEAELGRLFSPCRCKGTMRYVHVECLNRWRSAATKKESYFQCDQCKYQYNFQRTRWAGLLVNRGLPSPPPWWLYEHTR